MDKEAQYEHILYYIQRILASLRDSQIKKKSLEDLQHEIEKMQVFGKMIKVTQNNNTKNEEEN